MATARPQTMLISHWPKPAPASLGTFIFLLCGIGCVGALRLAGAGFGPVSYTHLPVRAAKFRDFFIKYLWEGIIKSFFFF